jgi:hypothetical protein
VAALIAGATAVARINHDDGHARERCLVLHEGSQLMEGPARVPDTLPLPKPFLRPVPDPLEIFKSDPPVGAFGLGNDGLRDAMVLVAPESTLPAGKFPEPLLCPFGSTPLEPPPVAMVSLSDALDIGPRMDLTLGIGREVDDAKVNPNEVRHGWLGRFGEIHRDQQEPFAVPPENEIGLSLGVRKPLTLVGSHHEWDDDPTAKRQQTDTIDTLEGQ